MDFSQDSHTEGLTGPLARPDAGGSLDGREPTSMQERYGAPQVRLTAPLLDAPRERIDVCERVLLNLQAFKDVRFGTVGRRLRTFAVFLDVGVVWMLLHYSKGDPRNIVYGAIFFSIFLIPANLICLRQTMMTSTIDPMVRAWFGMYGSRNLDSPRGELSAEYELSLDDVGFEQVLSWGYVIRVPWIALAKRPFKGRRGYVFGFDEGKLEAVFELLAGNNWVHKINEMPAECLYLPFDLVSRRPELLGQVKERIAWWREKFEGGSDSTRASIGRMIGEWMVDADDFEEVNEGRRAV